MRKLPAILNGAPIFDSPVAFVRPVLPSPEAIQDEIADIVLSGQLTKGRRLERFERSVAEHLGVRHAVAVSSCTTGLMLAYRCLGLEGDVVIPSFTFMATATSLVWAGLRPVFADVDFATTNLDPDAVDRAITPRTSAIVAVHNFGNPAEIDELKDVADRHGVKLLFDSAHGFGTLYQKAPVGPQGDAHAFSMSATKLVAAGEGGMVATGDDHLAEQIRIGREYGNDGAYNSVFAGLNGRLSEFNAILGYHSLQMLDGVVARRNRIAKLYRSRLETLPGLEFVDVRPGNRCSYKDFSIVVDPVSFGVSRDVLARALLAEGIDTRKYYAPPVHLQTAFRRFSPSDEAASADGGLPNTMLLAQRSLSLPIGGHLTDEMVHKVCDAIHRIHECRSGLAHLAPDRRAVVDVAG